MVEELPYIGIIIASSGTMNVDVDRRIVQATIKPWVH